MVAAEDNLADVFARWYESGRSGDERIADGVEIEADTAGDPDVEQLKDLTQEAPVIRRANQIIADAMRLQASDIHPETYREQLHDEIDEEHCQAGGAIMVNQWRCHAPF